MLKDRAGLKQRRLKVIKTEIESGLLSWNEQHQFISHGCSADETILLQFKFKLNRVLKIFMLL